jgi:hypothetical protein
LSRMFPSASRTARLPRATVEGFEIHYELVGLGTPGIAATATIVNKCGKNLSNHDLSEDIKRRQFGEDRPFKRRENLFDIIVGDYARNPSHRNWAGSDLSGGVQIRPGGIGNVLVPPTDPFDAIFKKHDIEFWLSANFEPGSEVRIRTDKGAELFNVKRRHVVNRNAMVECAKEWRRRRRPAREI